MAGGNSTTIIKECGLHHIGLQIRDWDTTLELYRDTLEMEIVADFIGKTSKRRIVLMDVGDGSHIELFAPTTGTPPLGSPAANDPLTHFALATTDVRATVERIRRAGYEITVEPKDVSMQDIRATIAFFKGPNGEVIELFHMH
jgi:glyoxylase I family protein